MKTKILSILITFLIISNCSIHKNTITYRGSNAKDEIILIFNKNNPFNKNGMLIVNQNDTTYFKYKIEKTNVFIGKDTMTKQKKTKFYIYRFIINATDTSKYFYSGFISSKKTGDTLFGYNKLILIRQD